MIAMLVAVETFFLFCTIFLSFDHRRTLFPVPTTPSPVDITTVDYDNDTADEFLANYSIYCEKFLIPQAHNVQHYQRKLPICPCIPKDLGLYFVVVH